MLFVPSVALMQLALEGRFLSEPRSRVGGVWMSFSSLNVIYPFFVLSLFLNLEEGLLEEFRVLHLV